MDVGSNHTSIETVRPSPKRDASGLGSSWHEPAPRDMILVDCCFDRGSLASRKLKKLPLSFTLPLYDHLDFLFQIDGLNLPRSRQDRELVSSNPCHGGMEAKTKV